MIFKALFGRKEDTLRSRGRRHQGSPHPHPDGRRAGRARLPGLRRRIRPLVAARLHVGQGQARRDRHRAEDGRPLLSSAFRTGASRSGARCSPSTGRTTSSSPGRYRLTVRPRTATLRQAASMSASRPTTPARPTSSSSTATSSATRATGRSTGTTWRRGRAGRRSSPPMPRPSGPPDRRCQSGKPLHGKGRRHEAEDHSVSSRADIGVTVDRLLGQFLLLRDRRHPAFDHRPPLAVLPVGVRTPAVRDVAAGIAGVRLFQALEPGGASFLLMAVRARSPL